MGSHNTKRTLKHQAYAIIIMLATLASGTTGAAATTATTARSSVRKAAPAAVTITKSNGSTLGDFELTANITGIAGSNVDYVEFFECTTPVKLAANNSNTKDYNAPFKAAVTGKGGGTYTYTAQVTDGGGNIVAESAPFTVTIDAPIAPEVKLVEPANNRIFEAGDSIQLKAQATARSGGSVTRVEFYNGGTKLGEATAAAGGTYNYTWTGAPQNKEYKLKAKVFTASAAAVESSPVSVTVTPPAATIKIKDTDYAIPTNGTARYVDGNTGNDANNGLTTATAWKTIRHALSAAPAGATIAIRGGTYREGGVSGAGAANGPLSVNKRLTLQPFWSGNVNEKSEKVWLKGSQIIESGEWTRDTTPGNPTNGLYSMPWAHEFRRPTAVKNTSVDYAANPMAGAGDQVFVNGRPLVQVAHFEACDLQFVPVDCTSAEVKPGTFCLDYGSNRTSAADNRLYIADNPAGKTIEATVDEMGLTIYDTADDRNADVVIRGLGFAHYAHTAVNGNAMRLRIEDNTFVWNAISGIGSAPIGAAETRNVTYREANDLSDSPRGNLQIRGNTFSYNSMVGAQTAAAHNMVFENNVVSWNNMERFRMAWSAAGAKFIWGDGQIFRGNVFEDNLATGLWLDLSVTDVTVVNNIARRNKSIGLFYEVSSRAIIASNLAVENASGIQVSGSSHVKVYNNTLVNNNKAIFVQDYSRINVPAKNAAPVEIAVVNAEVAADIRFETKDVDIINNIFSNAKSANEMVEVSDGDCGDVGFPCNDAEIDYARLDDNAYYRRDTAKPTNLVKWYPQTNVGARSFKTLAAVGSAAGFRSVGQEVNGWENTSDLAINPFFRNEATEDYRLNSNSNNPALLTGQGLPATVSWTLPNGQTKTMALASAVGVAANVPVNRGALNDSILKPSTAPPMNTPPTVELTAPTANQTVTFGTPVTLSAIATDANGMVAKVEFWSGDIKLGEDTTAQSGNVYSISWTPAAVGSYSITARAVDNQNATNASEAITLTVEAPAPPPPTLTITSFRLVNANTNQPISAFNPIANNAVIDLSLLPTQNLNICANVSAGTAGSVVLTMTGGANNYTRTENGAPYCLGTNGSGTIGALNPPLAPGTYALTATPYSGANGAGTAGSSQTTVFTVPAPNTAPTVALTSPTSNQVVPRGTAVALSATAADADGTVQSVQFLLGTTVIAVGTRVGSTNSFAATWTPSAAGTYSITARAADDDNASSTSAAQTLIVNTAPVVAQTTASGNFTAPATVALSATATDPDAAGSISRVEFRNGTQLLGTATRVGTSNNYSYNWTNVAAGAYQITAVAVDNHNAVSSSAVASITVQAPAPVQAPYPTGSAPRSVPGRIEAENFDVGGEAVAYHDETASNQGNSQYRGAEAVDVKTTVDGGSTQKSIGFFQAGEWLEYTINVPTAGTYNLRARVSAAQAGRQLKISVGGAPKALISVPNTSSYDSYTTVEVPNVALSAGVQVMRVEVPSNAPDWLDFNWLEFVSTDEYTLVWADEFDVDGRPNPANWKFENGFARNEERQWYQPDNARVENGMLIIEGRRERKRNPNYVAGSSDWKKNREFADYTSASLQTNGLHNWRYGRFEMRGRIDTRAGLWPAFWTLGTARPWPGNGEVDIMEYYRGILLANLIWGGGANGKSTAKSFRKLITEFADPNWSSKFHVWRMDWDENRIRLYVDDVLVNNVDLSTTFNRTAQNEVGANPYREPHYILLNLAIGGSQGGGAAGGESLPGGNPANTVFPARFEVDYVRVYQKP